MSIKGPEGVSITMSTLAGSKGNNGVRTGELSAFAEKRKDVATSLDKKAFLGPDYDRFLRRSVVDVAIGLIDIQKEKNNGRVVDEVNSLSESFVKSKFGVGTVGEFKERINAQNYNSGAVQRSYERLTKSVKFLLNKKGFDDNKLSMMSDSDIDKELFENLKGIGSDIKKVLVVDIDLNNILKGVNRIVNQPDILDQGKKKEMDLKAIDRATVKTEDLLEKAFEESSLSLEKQSALTIDYLTILRDEIEKDRGDAEVEDCIVDFISGHILRKGLIIDEDGELKSTNGDDFELLKDSEGNTQYDADGNKIYMNPETVNWITQREENMEDLIMIISNGEFSDIREIDAILNNKDEILLSDYIKERYIGDLNGGEKSDLLMIKDQLGRWFCDAIGRNSKEGNDETNRKVLGTLNLIMIEKMLPMKASGLGLDIVTNISDDVLIKKELRQVCNLDMNGSFIRMENHNGFSSIETKNNLMEEIKSTVKRITDDNPRYINGDKKYQTEVDLIAKWLNNRVSLFNDLIERQRQEQERSVSIPTGNTEKDRNDRLVMARDLLKYIKDSGSPPGSLNIMEQCTKLFKMTRMEEVEPEIKAEIKARLNLSFMFYHMHAAGGLLNNRGQSIEDAHEQGFKEGMLLNQENVAFYFKDGANGMPVADCWDAIEDLNFGYENGVKVDGNDSYYRLLVKMMGIDYSSIKYGYDTKTGEKDKIDCTSPTGKAAFKRLSVGNSEGQLLIHMKKNGMKFLGEKDLTDDQYLSKWTIEKRAKFVGEFFKIQNPESVFWGSRAEEPMHFNYFTDVNNIRREMVKDVVLDKIKDKREAINTANPTGKQLSVDQETLQMGFELAEQLMEATAESSVFNPCFAGHNDFSELILTEANTKDRQKKMKTIGYRLVMDEVVSLYTSWVRFISGEKSGDRRSVFKPLYAKDINANKMSEPKNDSYFLYTAILPKKILPVQTFLMKEEIGIKEALSIEFWKKLFDPTSKVIGYGQDVLTQEVDKTKIMKISSSNKDEEKKNKELSIYRLRKLEVQTILLSAARPTSDWSRDDVYKLGLILKEKYMIQPLPGIGNKIETESFITETDWDNLTKNNADFVQDMDYKESVARHAFKLEESAKPPVFVKGLFTGGKR